MIKILILILSLAVVCSGSEIYDYLNWRLQLPSISEVGGNLQPFAICSESFSASLKSCKLYGIDDFSWNNIFLSYGLGSFGLAGEIGVYGISNYFGMHDLYINDRYAVYLAAIPMQPLAVRIGYVYESEQFGDLDIYGSSSMNLSAAIKIDRLYAAISIENVMLEKPYESSKFNKIGFRSDCFYRIYDWTGISGSLCKSNIGDYRWQFAQDVMITDFLGIVLGYAGNPNSLYWAAKIRYKYLEFELSNSNTAYLESSIIVTLSFRISTK